MHVVPVFIITAKWRAVAYTVRCPMATIAMFAQGSSVVGEPGPSRPRSDGEIQPEDIVAAAPLGIEPCVLRGRGVCVNHTATLALVRPVKICTLPASTRDVLRRPVQRHRRIEVASQQPCHAERRCVDVGAVVGAHLIDGDGARGLTEAPVADRSGGEDGVAVEQLGAASQQVGDFEQVGFLDGRLHIGGRDGVGRGEGDGRGVVVVVGVGGLVGV